MNNPDFIIVGAPKSGTTSLWGYLSQHPDVFMTEKKEPMFFCGYTPDFIGPISKGYNRDMVTDADKYRQLFSSAKIGQITGEASTDYLSCFDAPKSIHKWNPAIKIIMVLRNPIERACSEHQHLLRDQHEDLSLLEALKCEHQRFENGYVPLFWHVKRGLYADAVQKYLDQFGKEQVKIFLFDDLKSRPQHVFDELLSFLELPGFKVNLERKWNTSGIPKSPLLQKLYLSWNRADKNARWKKNLQCIVPSKKIRQKLRGYFLKANLKKDKKYSYKELSFLAERFREDIEKLEKILERDLKHWMSVPEKKSVDSNETNGSSE